MTQFGDLGSLEQDEIVFETLTMNSGVCIIAYALANVEYISLAISLNSTFQSAAIPVD